MKIQVRVHPRARRERVQRGDVWEVWVREAPEKGMANRRLVELVAEELGVPKTKIRIIRGAASRNKLLEVEDA